MTTGTATTTTTETPASTTTTPASTAAQTQTSAAASTSTAETPAGETAATGATTTPVETTTTTTTETPWQDALVGDLKTDPLFRGYKTVDDLAQAHAHLTKLKGAKASEILKIPSKPRDQDPEAWTAFDAARGVPADAADYKIELAPEAAADTPELANVLRELGGKAKFDNGQMTAVIETLNTLGKEAAEAEVKAADAETAETTTTLKQEWGAAYEGNARRIGKLIREAVDASLAGVKDPAEKATQAEAATADLQAKLGSNLTLQRVLAHALNKMAEPSTPEDGNPASQTQLTPAAATAALNAFEADKEKMAALTTRSHPQHAAVLAERASLLAQKRGEKRPDQT